MKHPFLLAALFSAVTFSAHAEVSPIRITVEQIAKTETKDKQGHDKTQIRSLKIQLDNNSAQAFDALTVKYWFLGHAVDEHGMKAIAEGERKSAITPRGKDIVESEVVSKHFVEAHVEKKGKSTTKVPASGEKILGYAVRVLNDGKVVSEYYSDPSCKAAIDSPAAKTESKPAAKPGAKPAAK